MPDADEGVSLTSDDGSEQATTTMSWAEVWGQLGLDADAELSTTQARLAAGAYPVEQSVEAAVDDGALAETYFEAAGPKGQPTQQVHGGYRLVGEPQDGGRDE